MFSNLEAIWRSGANMRRRHASIAVVLAAAVASAASAQEVPDPMPGPIAQGIEVTLSPVADGLTAPNWGIDAGGGGEIYVSDQAGVLWAVNPQMHTKRVLLDVSALLVPLGLRGPGSYDERGLLGVAFHPDYLSNGRLFVYMSAPSNGPADFTVDLPAGEAFDHQAVIVEWTVHNPGAPGAVADPATARELLRVDEPQFNHDGGALGFGPDGMLYISLGDGGAADDQDGPRNGRGEVFGHGPSGNGQNINTALGSVLRIDVDGANSANGRYGIPADNPFVGGAGLDEIWAYGFRNPFRFSFDRLTGQLYIADVGQHDLEEVNIGVSGGNFGWRWKEGSYFFDPNGPDRGFVTWTDPGAPPDLIDPIAQFDHDEGAAIIGGFVYRGSAIPALMGSYVFGDYSGRIFYLDRRRTVREMRFSDRAELGLRALGFAQDGDGELYVLANETGVPFGDTGVVLRLDQTAGCEQNSAPQAACDPWVEVAAGEDCEWYAESEQLVGDSMDPDGDTLVCHARPSFGFGLRSTRAIVQCEDRCGASDKCETLVVPVDVTGPTLNAGTVEWTIPLEERDRYNWHNVKDVCAMTWNDNCTSDRRVRRGIIDIQSDDPDEVIGGEPGSFRSEGIGADWYGFILNLNRNNIGPRTYTFTYAAMDLDGNVGTTECRVKVFDPDAEPTPCEAYCSAIADTCMGANAQYADDDECAAACAGISQDGEDGNMAGDSLQCRMNHLGLAAGNPAVHCPHAGPDGGGVCAAPPGVVVAVDIMNFSMNPDPIEIEVGTTVRWTNLDFAGHTVTSGDPGDVDAGAIFGSPVLGQNDTFEHTFDEAGAFAYFCRPHSAFMNGFLVMVVDPNAPTPCEAYCAEIAQTCDGVNAQYNGDAECAEDRGARGLGR